MRLRILLISLIVLAIGWYSYQYWQSQQLAGITDFDSCAAAPGSQVQYSYPGVCITRDGSRFVQPTPTSRTLEPNLSDEMLGFSIDTPPILSRTESTVSGQKTIYYCDQPDYSNTSCQSRGITIEVYEFPEFGGICPEGLTKINLAGLETTYCDYLPTHSLSQIYLTQPEKLSYSIRAVYDSVLTKNQILQILESFRFTDQ